MKKKQKIRVSIVKWSGYELDGGLPEAIAKLQKLIEENPNCFDFHIEVESEGGYYNSCSTNIIVDAYRWETDEELKQRKIASKKAAEARAINEKRKAEENEKRERSLYESLKKKFDNEINGK